MAEDRYVLEICCNQVKDYSTISKILGVDPSFPSEDWYLVVIQKYPPFGYPASEDYQDWDDDDSEPRSQISNFLDLLEGKYQELAKVGVDRKDITIWYYYEYDGQCNMEFSPEITKQLGENEITLCVTCWDSGWKDSTA